MCVLKPLPQPFEPAVILLSDTSSRGTARQSMKDILCEKNKGILFFYYLFGDYL